MEREEIIEKFSEFLRDFYYNELVSAVSEGKKSIEIDFSLLDNFDTELSDELIERPEEALPLAEESVKQIDLPGEPRLKIRFFGLPENKEIRIRNMRAEHIGKLIAVDGIVKRASEVRPEVSEAIFQCPDCGKNISIIQTERIIRPPFECDCGCRKNFRLIDQKLYDARWITIEEPFEITSGERPSTITIFLKEDLTSPRMQNKTEPGNRIKIVGVLKQLPRRMKGTRSRQMEIYVEANFIEAIEVEWEELEITGDDEKRIVELTKDPQIYNKLVASIAPTLYGMEFIKEAIALQLFGGESHTQRDKSRVRGDIHILLVGDPSCLVADERVIMSDGTIMKIGEFGSGHLQKINYKVHMGMGRKTAQANKFHIYKNQPIVEIITETGKSIKGTLNQPVLIVENRCQFWRRLDKVRIGDKVRILPNIECRKKTLVKTNWIDYPHYHKSWQIKIPKFIDEKLAGLFGYILADGWIEKRRVGFIVNEDEFDIVSKLKEFFKDCFDAPISNYKHSLASEKITYYQVCRTHVAKLLSFLNEKRVPNYIFISGNSVVASFLRWLYEGDGCVFSKGRSRLSVSLRSTNIELLRDVQILLLRFGIHSRVLWESKGRNVKIKGREIKSSPSGSLMIRRSESVIKFWQNIGFASRKKNDKLKQVVEYAKNHIHRIHKSRTEKIVKINKLPPQNVFDIEVPKYHRFVANGIVVHNTAKSALMKVVSGLIPRGRYVSGKGVSVDFDDPVIFRENGAIKTELIGKIIDRYYSKDETGFAANSNIEVACFNPETFKMEWRPVTRVLRHFVDDEIFKILLRTGREVRVTGGHSIFAIDKNKVIAKKVCNLKVGDILLIPNKIPENDNKIVKINLLKELKKLNTNEIKFIEEHSEFIKSKFSRHKIPKILDVNKDLMMLLGYYIADGSIDYDGKNEFKVKFDIDRKDKEIINDIKNISKKLFGVDAKEYKRSDSNCNNVYIHDKIVCLILKEIIKVGTDAHTKKVPEIVFNVNPELQKWFLYALVKGDYGVTVSKNLISDILYLFLLNGVVSSFTTRRVDKIVKFPDGHESKICGEFYELKLPKIKKILEKQFHNSNLHSRVPLEFFQSDLIKVIGNNEYIRVSDSGFKKINSKFKKLIYDRLEIIGNCIDSDKLSKIIGRNRKSSEQYLKSLLHRGLVKKDGKIYKISERGRKLLEEIEFLSKLRNSDLAFLKIEKIEKIKPTSRFVYDFCIDKYENFVAGFGGVLCHNTGAGLTATVIKDEEFLGGWVLEAGALVMCNRSLLAIDEFEKVDKADQVAMHEAMEQQTISIAKANIIATLPSRTSILGGGNPKFGRFDPYLPIKEQIDVPETILSRFDLKFALRDIPNPEVDEKVAEHILRARHYGTEEIKPFVEEEFLKRYVAYARKNCHPKLSREAGDAIKDFFVKLREKATGGEAPVPITLRQYEALIRLAEASAKVQLRDVVTKEDALRAINLMKASLREFGFDPDSGRIDIDRVEGHITATQRGRIRVLIEVIDELAKIFGKEIPVDEVIRQARDQGVTNPEEILRQMRDEGLLIEPRENFIQKV